MLKFGAENERKEVKKLSSNQFIFFIPALLLDYLYIFVQQVVDFAKLARKKVLRHLICLNVS
jgi:hypothetical protein